MNESITRCKRTSRGMQDIGGDVVEMESGVATKKRVFEITNYYVGGPTPSPL